MSNQPITTSQISFAGGLNAMSSPHGIGEDEVQSSTNVDYSLELGAAQARRGSQRIVRGIQTGTSTSNARLVMLARDYGLSTGVWDDNAIPWYSADDSGNIYGMDFPGQFVRFTGYNGGAQQEVIAGFTQYGPYTYLANGTAALKTADGANTADWLIPQADQPTVTITPQFAAGPPFVGFAGTGGVGTYGASEGTITGTSTTTIFSSAVPIVLATCTTGTGSRIVISGPTVSSATNWEDPIVFVTLPTGTGLTSGAGTYTLGGAIDFHQGYPGGDITGTYTGTATITQTLTLGGYGTDYILLSLPDQQSVVTIQRDLSVGDTSFTNYWHSETTADAISDASLDPVAALLAAQGQATLQAQQDSLNASRGSLQPILNPRGGGSTIPPSRKIIAKTSVSGSVSPWSVSRSDYQFIGSIASPDFTSIQAVRIIIEFNTTGKKAIIGGVLTYGGLGYCLNDQAAGISYYQTFARVENGFIVAEGNPSNPSPPQNCQFGHAAIVCASNSNTSAGVTHRVFYRTGGLLSDAYRVGSCTITSGTATIYDYALPDMLVIGEPSMRRNLWSVWPSPSAGTGLPGVNAISLPWQSRVWIGVQNQLYWSWPGQPSQIQDDSQTQVADNGDNISAILPAQNLVIVNQNSVYEMSGSIFEGVAQNWTLTRTLAKRGSAAPRTCVNTPYGILLFGYDGISFYKQGFGQDVELQWIYDKIGDLWKGNGATDPAALKGRMPGMNATYIFNACAAYKDEKVYLAVPTGQQTDAQTVFVLDMAHEKVWMYNYPGISILSLFWDRVTNRLAAGTPHGTVHQLEIGLVDQDVNAQPLPIVWSYTTREWSTPVNRILENLQVENVGSATWIADVDNTNTFTLATIVSPVKNWSQAPLQGVLGDNLNFIFQGTASGSVQSIYEMSWDSIPEGEKNTFFQTDPVAVPSENYIKTWLVDINPLQGTTTGSFILDGTVLAIGTFSAINGGYDPGKRHIFEVGLPNVTYGKNVHCVFRGDPFHFYDVNYEFEPKPYTKGTWLVTYKKAGGVSQADMARFYAIDIEGLATHTITNTWIIDGSVFSINTLTFGATDVGEEVGIVRNYLDQIPFPPGGRGYLFQQQMVSGAPFKVWRASLDFDRIGVKGLSRVTLNGTPA